MLIESLSYQNPSELTAYFSHLPGTVLLDSSAQHETLARYSYLAVDPFITLEHNDKNKNPFEQLNKLLGMFQLPLQKPGILPGGAFGYFSYELNGYLETLPEPKKTDINCPDMVFGFYDLVVTFDHLKKKVYLVSTGFPELDLEKQKQRAEERRGWFLESIKKPVKIGPFVSLVDPEKIKNNFSKKEYCNSVNEVKEYILNGDVFEVNISSSCRAKLPKNIDVFSLFQKIKKINPAPFSSFLNFDSVKLVSSSPERFLSLYDGKVESRPIKGTRKRYKNRVKDRDAMDKLKESEKDHSENIMIVDLVRNDLSRVCLPGTIKVTQLCSVETFETVHHLVSAVEGELHPEFTAIDLLKVAFPGGSITGAPKVRAMEIIHEIEPTPRGPYCGAIGYIGFDGRMDTSITIRTFVIKDDCITFQSGGAVTLDSDPEEEYEEMRAKSAALINVLTEE